MKSKNPLLLLFLFVAFALVSCEKKGPAEKLGEEIDRTIDKVGEAVDPKGPGEKIGEALDKAADKATGN